MNSGSQRTRTSGGLRELVLKVLVVAAASTPLVALAWVFRGDLEARFLDRLILFASTRLSDQDRERYLRMVAEETPGLYRPVSEPAVGRTMTPRTSKRFRGAEMAVNNAGMRDRDDYRSKRPGVLRIVCLGDSATAGVGGPEEDRWCDQLESALAGRVRPAGSEVEAYALAVPSWTARNEASYLASRVTAYRPDLVLGLLVYNDVDLTAGVLGNGHQTAAFSPERRAAGSGAPTASLPFRFGVARANLLASGLGEESRRRWREAFAAWRRLEEVLERSGGRLVLGVVAGVDPLFDELVRHHHAASGLGCPLIFTGPRRHNLRHDPHPARRGHAAIAGDFLDALAAPGWLDLGPTAAEPANGPPPPASGPPRPERLRALQEEAAGRLPEALEFDALTPDAVQGLLAGVFPRSREEPLNGGAWGSTETLFLLRRRPGGRAVAVTVEVPAREELFPFALELRAGGGVPAVLHLATSAQAGRHELAAALDPGDSEPVVEVALATASYWCEIADPTMKSYRLVAATQR